jgi:hypothetical protein
MMYHHTTRNAKEKGRTIGFVVTAPISPRSTPARGTNYRNATSGSALHRSHAVGATTTRTPGFPPTSISSAVVR